MCDRASAGQVVQMLYKCVLHHSYIICRTSYLVVYQRTSLFQFIIELCLLSAMPVKTGVLSVHPSGSHIFLKEIYVLTFRFICDLCFPPLPLTSK